jgi:BirA family biotin operon repressor/biotin-[acetyl-CoA-carboxylase] ligase
LAEAVEGATGLRVDIKWPNDLLVGRRKLAGILAETGQFGTVVLGYGINVGLNSYPPALVDRATSLESELGRPIDRATVCVETLASVSARYRDLLSGRFDVILDAWRSRSPTGTGARVTWSTPHGPLTGVTMGIDRRGALIVKVGERTESILGGEVIWG